MDLDGITQETLDAIKKSTNGFTSSTGLTGIDLTPYVVLVPIITRTLDSIGRETSTDGNKFTQWKALLSVNNQQPNPAVGADFAGNLVKLLEQDMQSPYVPLAMGYTVTQDAVDYAKGYADARALTVMQTLQQLRQGENKLLIGGQAYALPTIAQPTLVQSDTGGSIAASTTVHVAVAARSGFNYYYGGSGACCADTTVTTSSNAAGTHSVSASVAAVKGAVAYDWFVGTSSGNRKYLTTTTVASVTITAVPGLDQALPNLHDLSTTVPAGPGPTADSSFDSSKQLNGIIANIVGDFSTSGLVTPGSGTASSSTFKDVGGLTLTASGGSIAEIDDFLLSIYSTSRLSPDALWMSAHHAQDISNKILSGTSAPTFLQPADKTDRANAVVGSFAGTYINRAAGGEPVDIKVDPNMPNGTIVARTDRIPYPGANIDAAWKVRCLRDYADFSYGASRTTGQAGGGPREDGEVRSQETLVCRAPLAQGVMANVAVG